MLLYYNTLCKSSGSDRMGKVTCISRHHGENELTHFSLSMVNLPDGHMRAHYQQQQHHPTMHAYNSRNSLVLIDIVESVFFGRFLYLCVRNLHPCGFSWSAVAPPCPRLS